MAKADYLKQKSAIDAELKNIRAEIRNSEADLAAIPTPAELQSFERFTAEISKRLARKQDPKPEEKRELLDLLHAKVYITNEGKVRVEGWGVASADGQLSTTSS